MDIPKKIKLYCDCEDNDYDEGICLICHLPKKDIWPNKLGEKINEIIDYLRLNGEDDLR